MNININFFTKNLIILCFIGLLSSCAKFNEEMNLFKKLVNTDVNDISRGSKTKS